MAPGPAPTGCLFGHPKTGTAIAKWLPKGKGSEILRDIRLMAGATGNLAIRTESRVEEQAFAELRRARVVRGTVGWISGHGFERRQ